MPTFTLESFAALMMRVALEMPAAQHTAMEQAAVVVETEAKRVIGTYDYGWPPLAEATIARKANGDTPLLETGEMRDSIEHISSAKEAHIGSNNDKAVWQELGTSRGIPPRPFLAGALHHKSDEVVLIIGDEIGGLLSTGKLPKAGTAFERWGERFVEHAVRELWHDAKEGFNNMMEDEQKQ
jgi:phage gpG-like protein